MDSKALIAFLKSLTVIIPLVIVLVRFNKIDRSYYPFVIYLIISFLTEVLTFFFYALPRRSNAPISNLYVLIEWIVLLWLFLRWGFFKKSKKLIYTLALFIIAVWITENIILGNFAKDYSPFYRIVYNFIIVLISTNIINYTIIHDHEVLFKNPRFLICLSFIIVFIYKLIYEWIYQYSTASELKELRSIMIAAFGYVNAFQKLLCALAAIYIPARENN